MLLCLGLLVISSTPGIDETVGKLLTIIAVMLGLNGITFFLLIFLRLGTEQGRLSDGDKSSVQKKIIKEDERPKRAIQVIRPEKIMKRY